MVIINGTTGIDTIQASSIPNGSITSAKIVDGTITDADLGLSVKPMFSAYIGGTNQTVSSSIWTKIALTAKEYDTTNAFDNITNFRFQPTKNGKYQVSGNLIVNASSGVTKVAVSVYKNGTFYKIGNYTVVSSTNQDIYVGVSCIADLNGTTDYLELYGFMVGTGTCLFGNAQFGTYFQAHYIGA